MSAHTSGRSFRTSFGLERLPRSSGVFPRSVGFAILKSFLTYVSYFDILAAHILSRRRVNLITPAIAHT